LNAAVWRLLTPVPALFVPVPERIHPVRSLFEAARE